MKASSPAVLRSLTVPLSLAFLAACGSSKTTSGGAGPPAQELPAEFSVFLADYDFAGVLRPYLYDFETGGSRRLVASLPTGVGLSPFGAVLSPDGTTLVVNLAGINGELTRIIDLETGATRTPAFGGGSGPQFGRGEEGGSIFRFSPDSAFALVQRGFGDFFLTDGKGQNITPLRVEGDPVFPNGWIGDSSQLLVTSYDALGDSGRLSLIDVASGTVTHFDPAPGDTVDIDEVAVSANSEVAVIAMEVSGTAGSETVEVATIDLSTGDVVRWPVPDLEEDSIQVSDDGSHVAYMTFATATVGPHVYIAERATGMAEIVSSPAIDPLETDVDLMRFEPGGDRLAFVSNHREVDTYEITLAALGMTSFAVDPMAPVDSEVEEMEWSPTGRYLAYDFDSSTGDDVYAFDADSTALPFPVSGAAVADLSAEFVWSPLSDYLLVRERLIGTNRWVTSAYSSSDWGQRRELGEAWRASSFSPSDPATGPVQFSEDGAGVAWRSSPSGVLESMSLWGAELADPDGTAPTLLSDNGTATTGATLGQFWLRSSEPPASGRVSD